MVTMVYSTSGELLYDQLSLGINVSFCQTNSKTNGARDLGQRITDVTTRKSRIGNTIEITVA